MMLDFEGMTALARAGLARVRRSIAGDDETQYLDPLMIVDARITPARKVCKNFTDRGSLVETVCDEYAYERPISPRRRTLPPLGGGLGRG